MLVLRQAVRVRLRVDHLGTRRLRGFVHVHRRAPRAPRVLLERVLAGEERPRALGGAAQLLVAEGVARPRRPRG